MTNTPFLTIVTRCYNRPKLLKNNIKSLKSQTDPDYEQVFIIDRIGKGLEAADKSLDAFKHYNTGRYIMVLDDDDKIIDSTFISTLKTTCQNSKNSPDVIIWRGQFVSPSKTLPLLNENWNKRPVRGKIGSFNYAVKRSIYNEYIHNCKSGVTGDYDFINSVLSLDVYTIWLENIFVECQVKGKGIQIADVEQRGHYKIIRKVH
jgi:glycosyltransferase involved in cell wall biosynthesis